jgi:hypothetical protein
MSQALPCVKAGRKLGQFRRSKSRPLEGWVHGERDLRLSCGGVSRSEP